MTIIINAIDEEFAAATGSNVNSGSGTSQFDYPPSATKDLVIESNTGDDSPYVFDVGDSYDLSWGGMGGNTFVEDAVVIRSDPLSLGGNAVVFEGTDQNGDLVQLVWSPGFDLEQWYFDHFNNGQSPGFYTTDQNPAENTTYVCFAAGSPVAVPGGVRAVEELRPGDPVHTLDHGVQPLRWVGQRRVGGRLAMAPVEFDIGAIGNDEVLRLSPQHRLLVQSWQAELWFGNAELLVPARAFVGQPGVRIAPVPQVTYVHLLLQRHEILSVAGVGCESLFLGDMATGLLTPPDDDALAEAGAMFPELLTERPERPMRTARKVLRVKEAAVLFDRAPMVDPPEPAFQCL